MMRVNVPGWIRKSGLPELKRPEDQARDLAESLAEGHKLGLLVESILSYYEKTRRVGHTRSLFSGLGFLNPTERLKPTVVAHSDQFAQILSPGNGVGIDNFPQWSAEHRVPLVWDNSALISVFLRVYKILTSYKEKILELGNQVNAAVDRAQAAEHQARTQICELQARLAKANKDFDTQKAEADQAKATAQLAIRHFREIQSRILTKIKDGCPVTNDVAAEMLFIPKFVQCLEGDHDWKFRNDSFDHEYGTEVIYLEECETCGITRLADPQDYDPEAP